MSTTLPTPPATVKVAATANTKTIAKTGDHILTVGDTLAGYRNGTVAKILKIVAVSGGWATGDNGAVFGRELDQNNSAKEAGDSQKQYYAWQLFSKE